MSSFFIRIAQRDPYILLRYILRGYFFYSANDLRICRTDFNQIFTKASETD